MELRSHGLMPEICGDLDTVKSHIHHLHQAKVLRAVVAAGGDGTVSAVATRCPVEVPIAVLPLGTENLLAKHLKITQDVHTLAAAISEMKTCCIDCGEANGKLFLIMVGIGFDAQVVFEMSRNRTGHIKHWSYAMPILRSIWQYRFPKLSISLEGENNESHSWHARWVFIANLPRYAAGLPIADWAKDDDGLLDVCSFRGGGVLRSLRYFGFLILNRHRYLTSFRSHKAHAVRIEAAEPVTYQIDGDHGGQLPLEIRILPRRLTVVVT
jgi:diacylglycerol kinase family enzyme